MKRVKHERVTETSVTPNGRVTRHKIDIVGNDLTATLRWCETHQEPVWVYRDGSYTCPHEWIITFDDGTHVLVDTPWEKVSA